MVMSTVSCSRYGPAPELNDIYDRLVELIEGSHEVNVLMFGAGLPTYARGDAEDKLVHRYYGVADTGRLYVTPYAKYATVEEMKAAIAEIYGQEYRESLFESLFSGYADAGLSLTVLARFSEDEKSLYQNENYKPLVTHVRVYDYAGMKIAKGSNGKYLQVEIPSYTELSEGVNATSGVWETVTVSFVYENGNWYLDSPSC